MLVDCNLFLLIDTEHFSPITDLSLLSISLGITSNPMVCDERIKWMKYAEHEQWLSFLPGPPTCQNFPDTSWQNISLPDPQG